jgi:hypothetical protein
MFGKEYILLVKAVPTSFFAEFFFSPNTSSHPWRGLDGGTPKEISD